VEFLDCKLAQAEERDRLRTFLTMLLADQVSEGIRHACFHRMGSATAGEDGVQLQLATIVVEVVEMEAFAPEGDVDS
jgi:hypothetical protein